MDGRQLPLQSASTSSPCGAPPRPERSASSPHSSHPGKKPPAPAPPPRRSSVKSLLHSQTLPSKPRIPKPPEVPKRMPLQTSGKLPGKPPVVPPRPTASASGKQVPLLGFKPSFTSLHHSRITKRERLSEPLSLLEFEKKYSSELPLQIEVLQGYTGPTPELSISTCDVYNVHFKQHRDVVVVSDERGHTFRVPISSALKFGLLYTPAENAVIATFNSVADILAQNAFPKVVCSTASWTTQDRKNSLDKGEVLVILKCKNRGLKVYSLLTKSTKLLPRKCKGFFTTDPSMTKLHLLEILEHVPNTLPTRAKIFLGDIKESSLRALRFDTVSLLERKVEASLVASTVCEDDESSESTTLLDIPLDNSFSEVEVVVVRDVTEQEDLYENTRTLLANFDVTKLTTIKNTESKHEYEAQSLFYESLRGTYEELGVKIEKPKALCPDKTSDLPVYATVNTPQSDITESCGSRENNYEDIGLFRPSHPLSRQASLQEIGLSPKPVPPPLVPTPPSPLPTAPPPLPRRQSFTLPASALPASQGASRKAASIKDRSFEDSQPPPVEASGGYPRATVNTPQSDITESCGSRENNYEDIGLFRPSHPLSRQASLQEIGLSPKPVPPPLVPTPPSPLPTSPPPLPRRQSFTMPASALPASQGASRKAASVKDRSFEDSQPPPGDASGGYPRANTLPRRASHRTTVQDDSVHEKSQTAMYTLLTFESENQMADDYVRMSPWLQSSLAGPGSELERLRAEVQQLKSTIANVHASSSTLNSEEDEDESVRENKRFLATLTVDQVLQLLDGMGLSKYRTTFSENGVSGDILLELDDNDLESELGVTSRIHRIKLLRISAGARSVKELIEHRTT